MLEPDEYDQLLVTNPFSDDSSPTVPSSHNHDILVTLTPDSSSEHHPLRTQPVSTVHPRNALDIPSVTATGNGCETRPRLTHMLSSDGSSTEVAAHPEQDWASGSEATQGDKSCNIVVHPVRPNDSFARVALRYGVSIAALRRANQLWPSDPIHLRTELFIPRADSPRVRHKPTHSLSSTEALPSAVDLTPSFPPDLFPSSLVSARNMIFSVLPARISLDSLSSKASASEDHELDDLRATRTYKIPASETAFAESGHELSILAPPAPHKLPGVALSSQVPHPPANSQRLGLDRISPVGNLRAQSISSSRTASLERLPRMQPFAAPPVRTCQLEPEPAMELPVRRRRV